MNLGALLEPEPLTQRRTLVAKCTMICELAPVRSLDWDSALDRCYFTSGFFGVGCFLRSCDLASSSDGSVWRRWAMTSLSIVSRRGDTWPFRWVVATSTRLCRYSASVISPRRYRSKSSLGPCELSLDGIMGRANVGMIELPFIGFFVRPINTEWRLRTNRSLDLSESMEPT